MQSQEQSHQKPEPLPSDEREMNTDPREQSQEQPRPQEDTNPSYTQGYSGLDQQGNWLREGEKLRPRSGHMQNKVGPLLLVLLLCMGFIAAGLFGLILNWLSWSLVAVVLITCVALLISNKRIVTRTLPPSIFQVMEHPQLNLRNHSGKISLRRGEPGIISVTATIHTRNFDHESIPVRYDQYGNSLTISSRVGSPFLFPGSRSIDFEITVPASCDIHISNGQGTVVLQGTRGNIRVYTDHGNIGAHDLQGQITLKTDHGSIQTSHLQGQIRLQTDHGNIEAHNLQSQITLKTDHGSIQTSHLQGQIHLQTDHGNISTNGLRGSAKLKTDKGNISVGQSTLTGSSRLSTDAGMISFDGVLESTGDYEMRSDKGAIAVTLPLDASFHLDAKTDLGLITTNLPQMPQQKKRVSGSVGRGPSHPRLRLRTDVGSINLSCG